MIHPLRDNIVCVPLEDVKKIGDLFLPDNKKQYLLQQRKMLVLYAGPKAKEHGVESGVIIHASEAFGDEFVHRGRKVFIGRTRDINGICEAEPIRDTAKYDS